MSLFAKDSMSLSSKESLSTCLANSSDGVPTIKVMPDNVSEVDEAKINYLVNIQTILAELRNRSNKVLCYLKHISEKQDS